MKVKQFLYLFFVTVVASSFLATSCDDDYQISDKELLESSKQTWLRFKEEANNSYVYVTTRSSWTGYKEETTTTVKEGSVVSRARKVFKLVDGEYVEQDIFLNTEEPAKTLDDIYLEAETDWLKPNKASTIYLETKNNGMISICGYVENRCTDDCFVGINIKSIDALK